MAFQYGSLFAGFSFYENQNLSSVYLGRGQPREAVMGTLFSSWQEASGTMIIVQAKEIHHVDIAKNPWGPEFVELHEARGQKVDHDFARLLASEWTLRLHLDAAYDSFGTEDFMTFTCTRERRGCFLGTAAFSSRQFSARGELYHGCLTILFEIIEDGVVPRERILILGQVHEKEMRGRYVILLHLGVFQAGSFIGVAEVPK